MSARFSFSYRSCYCFFLVIVVSLFYLCLSTDDDVLCLGSERQALLQFKHGLIDEAGRLASWDDGEESDCCRWVGIRCDNFTGHVHRIHLPALNGHCDGYIIDSEYEEALKQMLKGKLSSSLLHLKQLRHLDLSCNDFVGIQIPKFIGSLSNLRYLNLSMSNFIGMIPPQLGNLSELQVLCLGSETRSMMNNMEWLSSLHLLQHLDLSGVDLSKAINWLQVINTIPSLVQLHLSYCELSNIHPRVPSLNLTSLSLLDLSWNNFSSPLPPWIFSITSLVSLDLTSCYFYVPTPNSIGFHNLTSLESLHVARNNFMNSSLVLRDLSSVGSNLVSLDISHCGVSSSVLDSLYNLTSLRSLDLSINQLTKAIPKSLGNLCNLRDLDLSSNDFGNVSLTSLLIESVFKCKSPHLESLDVGWSKISGRIPDSIGRLSFLRSLYLSENLLSGAIPSSIGQLSSLKELYLSNNQLNGGLPYSIGRLSSLEVMDLSRNRLNGGLPYSIGGLSLLKELDLSDNRIAGTIPDSIGRLSSLETLHLSNNQLNGVLPYSIGGLSLLKELYLSNNQLNGGLSHSIGQLSSLQELDLSNNQLNGVVTEAHFSKLVNLKELNGGGNNLTLRTRIDNWIPPFQLERLNLNSWVLGPQFPLWLQSQKDLEMLNISNTQISSPMPSEFRRSLQQLPLYMLDMSDNHIQGTLVDIPTTTLLLDLSNNFFEGTLHDLLCSDGVKQTKVLYLDNNHLSGFIPECWDKWPFLKVLDLENNNLSGGIPTTIGSLYNLKSLNMRGNKLLGRLPTSLMNLTGLEILQLGRNGLVGSIPSWFGTQLSQLSILNLRSNNFDGTIPHTLCLLEHIQILDFAHNNLSGNIPTCFNNFIILTGNETISDEKFIFGIGTETVRGSDSLVTKGREDTYSTILGLVTLLDFSSNNLVGHIPSELTSLKALQSLNLSGNQLTGRIPEKIGDMKALISFDLSVNMLSGELPVSLSSLNFLSSFNVSHNNLKGRVPSSTQLQSFTNSSFFGNKLCGPPISESCAVGVEVPDDTEDQNVEDGAKWELIVSIVCGFASGFWIVLAPLIVSKSWRIAYFRFLSERRYKGGTKVVSVNGLDDHVSPERSQWLMIAPLATVESAPAL